MLTVRKAAARGQTQIGWLNSWHTFSFGEYHDPANMGFRDLRVINDDIVAPAQGFGLHPHRDMEIITVVLDGVLKHRDSLGSEGEIKPGDVQVMTAGSGIRHSEFNGSETGPVHLLQIWIMPERKGLPPAYNQKAFPASGRAGRLQRVIGRDNLDADGALKINQDVNLLLADLKPGEQVQHTLRPGRGAWIHIATGSATANGQKLVAGDAAAIEQESAVALTTQAPGAMVLVFDCK